MNRRSFLATLGAAAATSLAAPPNKPNIVLILADDLGYGDIGCFGNKRIQTPNIDRLAAGGLRFTDFHSNGAVCSPTRAALMTGRYQQRSGVDEVINAQTMRDGGLPVAETTVAEVLRAAGYTTAIYGKWHLGYDPKFHPDKQGFDEHRGYVSGNVDYFSHVDQAGYADWWHNGKLEDQPGYTTELVTRNAIEFIDRNKAKPFFLYLAHESVHAPYQGPKDKALRQVGQKGGGQDKGDVSATYAAMIEAMDEGVGRVLAKLKELPKARETFVFFCSDNGATNKGSNGALRGFKSQLWEGGHRVPAIAYWPGRIAADKTSDATALTMDLFPTFAEIAGAKIPSGLTLDGISLWPHMEKGEPLPPRAVFWGHGEQRAVRWKQWKLTRMTKDQTWLADLLRDISEKVNHAAEQPAIVTDLLGRLERWERSVS